ncbi:TonB-dependent receptor [Sphingosinicella sp. BN140058]|uniref:TonB-dependent receptor n=1 Tax=Sphingosinicella sp. BN140058 TaxID=1892855 RepID=UPI0010137826|nr:TonB-dependent receptor [Sphingosinicella sp. BN140058]QAY76539.1 TonB-dependent receptor [Sphingosinicella sp. BN140058]
MRIDLLCGAAIVATAGGPALAQQAETAPAEDAIVVTGQRAQQARSIALKRDALGITDVASADEIGQLPDRNVAEVVERLPGVGVQYDQGEGRYVAVRGVPSDLNSYTVNGFEIGNPDGNTRRLPLDVISGQLLNRVEVSKLKTADQEGQGLGATINLVTQTAFDFRAPFALQANVQAGYQELNDKVPVRGDLSVGGRFGADRQFGLLLGGSYSKRDFQSFGLYPDDWAPVAGATRGGLPINLKYTDYRLERERIGATGSFDWRPSDDHQFHVRGIYSRFTEDEYRQRYRLDFADGGQALVASGALVLAPDGLSGSSTATAQRSDLRLEYKEKSVLAGMIGGTSRFGPWTLDYGASRTHNEVIEPNQLWQFRNASAIGAVDFDFSDRLFTAAPRIPVGASNLQFRQYTAQDERGEEDIWAFRADARRALALGAESFVKFGAKYRTTDKSFDVANDIYNRGTTANRFTLVGLAGPAADVRVGGGRTYVIAPTIDADLIRAFTDGRLGSAQFVRDDAASLVNQTVSDLELEEDVLAGYAMADLDLGAIALTAGLRVERTSLDIAGFQLAGATVLPVSQQSDYTNWLPSLILRIAPADDVVVRLGYSRSVGRPSYASLSPGGQIVAEGDEADVSLGNPTLRPYVADSLDATGEWYFAPGGLLSLGAFAKFIRNPIFSATFQTDNGSVGGADYDRITFTQPQNGESADIIGLEASYQQQFSFLPGLLSGFGVNLNVTLLDSTLRVPGTTGADRTTGFPEQSDLLWGAQLFYQKGPIEASLAYHHTGRALIAADADPNADQYNDDLRRLDAKLSVAVTDRFTLFFEGQNLTDEPTRQYQGGHRDWVIQNERYGRTFWAGVSAHF